MVPRSKFPVLRSVAHFLFFPAVVLALTIWLTEGRVWAQVPMAPVPIPQVQMPTELQSCPGSDARADLCALLTGDASSRLPLDAESVSELRDFYADRDYSLAWSGSPEADAQSRAALDALSHADADGLDPLDYRPERISTTQAPAERDVLLTAAILRYARDLRLGRIPESERSDVDLPVSYFNGGHDLATALQAGSVSQFIAAQRPDNPQYARLAEALARYRANGSTERADIIAANMERWRWMPHQLESRYIMANEPAGELRVVDGGNIILTSRVITGKPTRPSPILRAVVHGIVVNPPWNVPADIARREILPKGRHYLAAHGFSWHDGQIQQHPGPHSALGTVKLDMPNAFNVYLHDTPGKKAFDQDDRNLSHGCIRVQEIVPLASIVMTGDADSGVEQIRDSIARRATRWMTAPVEIPVYFSYWTAVADDDGNVQFFPDVYGRDARLLQALHRSTTTLVSLAQ